MKSYDVFLSHNSQDKSLVEKIGCWLEDDANLIVWLDKWNLIPGDPWQEGLEDALDESKCCAVFLGPNGIGAWQNEEMRSALDERISKKSIRVVPVLLPGAVRPQKESELPRFLRRLTWVEFQNDWQEEQALHHLVCGIKGISPGRARSETLTDACPFRGLEVFREEDRSFFFGRYAVTQRLMDRLSSSRFLAVLGPSGSGKSSVVQAGLIPQFRETSLITLFSPRERPIEELAFALRTCYESKPPTEELINRLKDSQDGLHIISREVVENAVAAEGLLIVIDQFEELFTQTLSEKERRQFLAGILKAVETSNGPTSVILTMRSDFLGKCAFYPDLNTFINDHLIQIEPMSREELRSAIEEPAHLAGLVCEEGLVERILNDIDGASGELPLLEHALLELYRHRQGIQLTLRAYQDIGGIEGALSKRAETEYGKLDVAEKETIRKMLVLRLIQPGEGTEDTRRRATKEELLAVSEESHTAEVILEKWINARLLTSTHDASRGQILIDVAHEALIRKWDRMQNWMAENREAARLIGNLRQASSEWEAGGQETKYLWSDERVVEVVDMLGRLGLVKGRLTDSELGFLGPIDYESMLAELDDPATNHERRASIGVRLSLLDDRRPGVGLRPDKLPDIEWCQVPGGEITLRIERHGLISRLFRKYRKATFRVDPFYISKFPVTWMQYRVFFEADDGFREPTWWQGLDSQVEEQHRQFNQRENHPAVSVCWLEALAFCRWLTTKLGYEVRLPTEWEWQQAATGGNPHNEYPWGPAWDHGPANTYESGLQQTMAVGMYPLGASPVGALDMSGNVWEWCLNEFENIRRVEPSGEGRRSVRGGSWLSPRTIARCGYRDNRDFPLDRLNRVGFRLLCSSPIF